MRVVKVIFYTALAFFIAVSYRQIFVHTALHYDEVGNYLPAWNYAHHRQYAFTVQSPEKLSAISPFITIGPYVGYSLILFSWADTAWHLARIWIFLHAVILLFVLYFLVKKHFSKPAALLTCAILMFNGTFITYSTRIMGEIPAFMGYFLGFWAYTQGKEKKQSFWYLIAFIGFEISLLSKEYFAVIIGLTLFFIWIFEQKCRINAIFWIGMALPLGTVLWYFLHFKDLQTIQLYFKERQIYRTEFFVFSFTTLQWIAFKPLIGIGYVLHTLKCYLQKRHVDIFLWTFQTLYMIFFLISIGFERFGMGLFLISAIYVAEFLYGMHFIPALTQFQKIFISLFLAILIIQKSSYLLWKNAEKMPDIDVKPFQNKIIHTPELSLIPLVAKYHYQIPLYPPAALKYAENTQNLVKTIQKQYQHADVLILGEYAFTEYAYAYDRKIIQQHFEKIQVQDKYEIWIRKYYTNLLTKTEPDDW